VTLCKPSHLVVGSRYTYTVSGLAPGERVAFFVNSGAAGERCFGFAGGACVDLHRPLFLGARFADGEGVVNLTRVMRDVVPLGPMAVQALVLRGDDSFATAVTYAEVETDDEGRGGCDDADVCTEGLPDADGDTVSDACDECEGSNDLADGDDDGVPDACGWAGSTSGATPEYYPWRTESPPPIIAPEDCIAGDLALLEDQIKVVMPSRLHDDGVLLAGVSGWYDVYDLYFAESGARQQNEHSYVRISNEANPDGFPLLTNCGDEFVVEDNDNDGVPPGPTLVGTFWLEAGENAVHMTHWCEMYAAGECLEFFNDVPGHHCDDRGNPNSTHFKGEALCSVAVY
jgi:hypothetical protein